MFQSLYPKSGDKWWRKSIAQEKVRWDPIIAKLAENRVKQNFVLVHFRRIKLWREILCQRKGAQKKILKCFSSHFFQWDAEGEVSESWCSDNLWPWKKSRPLIIEYFRMCLKRCEKFYSIGNIRVQRYIGLTCASMAVYFR